MTGSADQGDAFAEAFALNNGLLKRVIAGMGMDGADGEDILQDVFIEATQRPGEYRGADEAARWLVRVTMTCCLQEFRKRRRFERAAREIAQSRDLASARDGEPESSLMRAEELDAVRTELRAMDEDHLAPLVLRYFCGMNSNEVGEALQLNASTVRSRLREARLALARRLMEKGVSP